MIYYIKRIISFIKTDFILLKTINIKCIIAYLLSFVILNTLSIIFKNKSIAQGEYISLFSIDIITDSSLTICNLVFFTYFFVQLKKQNFFRHLLTNRGFYIEEFELLLFAISLLVCLMPFILPFSFFYSPYETFETAFYYIVDIIGAMLIANWKLWKYIVFFLLYYTLYGVFVYIAVFIYNGSSDYFNFFIEEVSVHIITFIFMVLEIIMTKNTIVKSFKQISKE